MKVLKIDEKDIELAKREGTYTIWFNGERIELRFVNDSRK